ncbi:hypothetical protein D3C81_474870 [compost metagenome]
MVVIKVDAGRRAQAKGQRRGDTPAVVVDLVAAGDVAFVGHQVQATGNGIAELVVAIEGVALGLVAAPGPGAVQRVAQMRALAYQVDGTAGRAAATDGRVRPLGHFNGFDGEDFAGLGASVTYAVQVSIALGVEAADERAVTLWVAAFASAESNAWHGAQGILQGQGVGVLDHLLRDHGYRARGVYQRRGVLLRGGLVHLVIGAGLFSLAVDAGGIEGDGAAGGRIGGIDRRGTQGDTDGRHDQAWRTHSRWYVLAHCKEPSPRY